jgi:hypothetical protein
MDTSTGVIVLALVIAFAAIVYFTTKGRSKTDSVIGKISDKFNRNEER